MKNFILNILILLLVTSCSIKVDAPKKVVALQPYHHFENKWIDTIAESIEKTYDFKIVILPSIPLPQEAFTPNKGGRHRADSLIKFQKNTIPDSVDIIVGLTNKDISFTKRDKKGNILQPENKYLDWGIFGLGYRPGDSCIISTKRIHHPQQKIFLDRMKKVTMHEIGHNLNLPHCPSEYCVMQDAAETIQTIDKVHLKLCDDCFQRVNKKKWFF